jgi:multicomponent Na+:H+ antiporter subunit B
VTRTARLGVFAPGAALLLLLFVVGTRELPTVGTVTSVTGDLMNRVAVVERSATDVVTSVTFDYRGFDTLGEEFILYSSVLGVLLLLRDRGDPRKADSGSPRVRPPRPSDAVRALAQLFIALMVTAGLYLMAHGHQTPGGGFQGGVLLAAAPLLAYLATGPRMLSRVAPGLVLRVAEATGALAYLGLGLWGLSRGSYLTNPLPVGQPGRLFSAGSIPLLNVATALAVAGGFLVLLSAFLEKARESAETDSSAEDET